MGAGPDRNADFTPNRHSARYRPRHQPQIDRECLARIADPEGEGGASFVVVYDKAARATVDWVDTMRKAGASLPEWAGIPISIKDLFDVAGSVTTFASAVMADASPAKRDATVVERLRGAGFIPIGRTNMTEFAYGAIGLNARNGTPAAAWDRISRRIPGGSTSGGAISISDGMAYMALVSDSNRRAAGFRSRAPIRWRRASIR